MASAYLTDAQAEARLEDRFGIMGAPTVGDLEAASDELDSLGPFIGTQLVTDGTQARAFPRSLDHPYAGRVTATPDAVLDWVALRAHLMGATDGADASPAITSESARGVSRTYSVPKTGPSETRLRAAYDRLLPYFLKSGARL